MVYVIFLIKKHFVDTHNLRKNNKKDKFIDVYNGIKWELKQLDKTLDEVLINIKTDFHIFLKENHPEIDKNIIDVFMRNVGAPLNWSLDHDDYKFNDDIKPSKKEQIKKDIYAFICEHIYRKSKELKT